MRTSTFAFLLTLLLARTSVAEPPHRIGKALVTFYWLIDETTPRYRGDPSAELKDVRGHLIARTSQRFRRDLVMEGSGNLRDGRTVEYDRKVRGKNCFRLTRSKYGEGRLGCPLIPFRTIAVDPHFVKLGSTLSVPQMKGARLPDGTIHDGIFLADDRGHFRGSHIDIFTGIGPNASRPFARKGCGSRSHVTVYLVGDSTPDDCKRKARLARR
jgi:3D (Asp-Asp-Asp) domain-containing protein